MLSPVVRCSYCDRKAIARIRYAKLNLCEHHYIDFLRSKVRKTIDRYRLVERGSRILLAVSGGKDSAALADIMSVLAKDLNLEIVVLHIDLGLGEYSKKLRKNVEALAHELGLKLIVFDIVEELGVSILDLAKRSQRPICSVCGIVKRYLMNAAAIDLHCTYLATAHNADDMIAYIVKAFMNQDLASLSKLVPKTPAIDGLAIGRIRPFYEVYEREALLYVLARRIPFVHEECPFALRNALEHHLKRFFNNLEEVFPGTKISFLRKFARQASIYSAIAKQHTESISRCRECGLVSSGDICSFCKITARAVGKPLGAAVREFFRHHREAMI